MTRFRKSVSAILAISATLLLANCDAYAVGADKTVQTARPDYNSAANPH